MTHKLSTYRRSFQRNARISTSLEGIVVGIGPGVVTVQLSERGNILRNIPLIGPYPELGNRVIVEYNTTDKPRARLAPAAESVPSSTGVLPSGNNFVTDDETLGGSSVTNAENIAGVPVSFIPNAGDHLKALLFDYGGNQWIVGFPLASQVQTLQVVSGSLSTGILPARIYNAYNTNRSLTRIFLAADTAPTGAAIIVDILLNGTTVFTTPSNRPQIADGANTGESTTIEVPGWSTGDYLQVEIAQIGSSTPGSDLSVHIVSIPAP